MTNLAADVVHVAMIRNNYDPQLAADDLRRYRAANSASPGIAVIDEAIARLDPRKVQP